MKRGNEQRALLPGTLEMLILQTLWRGALHGYAVAQHIRQTSNEVLQVDEGSLYPALQRLLRENLVAAEWGVSSRNRRVRTYQLTPAGRSRLESERTGYERLVEAIARVMRPAQS